MLYFLYLDHAPLCSFLSLESALEACWPYWKEGRAASVVKVPAGTRRDELPGMKPMVVN